MGADDRMGKPASKRFNGKLGASAAVNRITYDTTFGVRIMLVDITEVKVLENYNLVLRFEGGTVGQIDIAKIISFKDIFAKLKVLSYFKTVFIDKESGTICWDNGADLSPCVLYSQIKK